jgi:hypothetical protein
MVTENPCPFEPLRQFYGGDGIGKPGQQKNPFPPPKLALYIRSRYQGSVFDTSAFYGT